MEVAICAIAKRENLYVNEWVNYHLNLGFDKIYLYDNNDEDYPFVGNYISNLDKVEIIKWNIDSNRFINQELSYRHFIENYSQLYDWVAFIDIDEFIHIDTLDVKDFLSRFSGEDNIALNWHIYGDDDIIEGNESIPVRDRFKINKITMDFSVYKTICNLKMHPNYRVCSMHFIADDDTEIGAPYVNSNLEKVKCNVDGRMECSYNDVMRNKCYIEHYQTKSLSEFLKYKFDINQYYTNISYYFRINDRTVEKEEYIRKFLESNRLSYG